MKKITRVGTLVLMALSIVLMIGCEKNETIIINAPNNNGGPGNGNGGNGGVVDSSTMCATLPWYVYQADQVPVYVWQASWVSGGTTKFDWDGDKNPEIDPASLLPYRATISSMLAGPLLDSLASNPYNPGYFIMGRLLEIKSMYCPDKRLTFTIVNAQRTFHGSSRFTNSVITLTGTRGETPWMKK